MRKRYEYLKQEVNLDTDGEEQKFRSNSIHTVSFFYGVAVIIALLILYGVAYAAYEVLPTPLKLSDEVKSIIIT